MRSFPCLVLALAASLSCAATQNPPRTLAEFVQSLHWDPAKRGPLLVLEPEDVIAKQGADGLAAFDRTRTSLMGLSAIIPTTMVVIDDSMQQQPNMYDGLPRHAKVLYLMTTLTSSQWESITGGGLGMSSLTQDQKAVLTSILPKPFKYSTFKVDRDGEPQPLDQGVLLGDSDRESVRLHVERTLSFMMPVVGQQGVTPRDTKDDHGAPGSKITERDADADFRPQNSFGVNIRQTVPNQQKASDLDFRASFVSGSMPLFPSEPIKDLLKRIGKATGLELYADLRVGDRKMTSIGLSAPTASILRAVALSVTGTFRKVGSAYILTSDLTGMGTRKMRLAAYDEELNRKVWDQETLWRQQIYKSGHLSQIRFRNDDSLVPGDSLAKKLDQPSRSDGAKVNASDLSEGLKQFVERQNQMYKTQQVAADGSEVKSEFDFSYILPNGDDTKPDFETLGTFDLYQNTNIAPRTTQESPEMPKVDLSSTQIPVHLIVSAETPMEALQAVETAATRGFKEIWLDTLSPDALQTALKTASSKQIRVSLAIRPFDYRVVADDASADRTLFGDTPPESWKRRMSGQEWALIRKNGSRPPEELGSISPLSTGYKTRMKTVLGLSSTPGLAGIRVLHSTPHGYNGPRVEYLSFPTPLFMEQGNFGYAEDLRVAFIRQRNIDPIDMCPPSINSNSDLRQPFFLDDKLRGSTSVYDGTDEPNPAMKGILDEYDTWLAKLNHDCLSKMLDAITEANPQVPILMDAIPLRMNAVNRNVLGLLPWKPGEPLPEIAEGVRGSMADFGNTILRLWVTGDEPDYAHMTLGYLTHLNPKLPQITGIAIDMTMLTPSQQQKWVENTFVVPAGK